MNVLGIESSCDETAAAVVRPDGEVISDVIASQIAEHAPYGGVVPELASRAHLRAILPVIEQAVAELPRGLDDVDAIAVTNGPGLVGALLVGLSAAKAIAWSRGLPIVGVNHLDGHLLAVHLRRGDDDPPPPPMPYVALLASGGHTALYEVRSEEDILLLGQTRDDAAGEAFDKAAKLLGLGYPGGPVIDRLASEGDGLAFDFPRPMAKKGNIDFSFSGLKTAVAYHVKAHGVPEDDGALADVCASFQHAVVDSLVTKALAACEMTGVGHLVLTGGVAANSGLRQHARDAAAKVGVTVHVPPFASCTDNAAMIAYAGARRLARGERDGLDIAPFSRAPGRKRGKIRDW
ncbi:MAG: tRNA (adenosine(37)-N6)-threonylcarbamoyltransferase complex transferase subunit TsaD [Deltaproteobacteria bacterium]|nr:tRNA (adenosine(37)-N6)-threonylcarbamoyltransferase complex transferase subunit TsaD [Deltaproteobacteria bacterium]